MIPGDAIVSTVTGRGVPNGLDAVVVRHAKGGDSVLSFKSYEKGREKWQGETLEGVWFDEEPPLDIYSEGLTRTNTTGGIAIVTFTPLQGMSDVVMQFLTADQVNTMVGKRAA
jgi:phage terminase large subunit-like protein